MLLTVVALAANAVAQVGWVQRNPATRPPARGHHSMTYDIARGVTVLFGGWTGSTIGDTWEWNGVSWTQKSPAVSPPARYGHALAFDIVRARVVLFGGTNDIVGLADTWEFDGTNWVQQQPTTMPGARSCCMEYDAARGRIVLFGGGAVAGGAVTTFNDTWEWNGVVWTQRSPATSPPPRWSHGMAYDFVRARTVMFGGDPDGHSQHLNDTWAWDGTNWTQVPAAGPSGTIGFGLANDATRELVVLFGGHATAHETWLLDHAAWRRDPRLPAPAARTWGSIAYDLIRGRTVLFGGWFFDDTWEYDPGVIARLTTYGSGCAGMSGVPSLRPVGASLPIVGTTFQLELLGIPGSAAAISIGLSNSQWTGGTLPFDLGALGMTGCTLHASPDVVFFTPVVAGRATLAWSLPNAPSLIGVRFYNQGFVLDPGINPLGATVSNAGAGIIGPF